MHHCRPYHVLYGLTTTCKYMYAPIAFGSPRYECVMGPAIGHEAIWLLPVVYMYWPGLLACWLLLARSLRPGVGAGGDFTRIDIHIRTVSVCIQKSSIALRGLLPFSTKFERSACIWLINP